MTDLISYPGLVPNETAVSRTTDDQSPITSKDRQGGERERERAEKEEEENVEEKDDGDGDDVKEEGTDFQKNEWGSRVSACAVETMEFPF